MNIPTEVVIFIATALFGVLSLCAHVLYGIDRKITTNFSWFDKRISLIEFKLGIQTPNEQ